MCPDIKSMYVIMKQYTHAYINREHMYSTY